MSSESANSSASVDLTANPPTALELFVAFAKMSVAGFGGVLVWARRAIVDQHRWMTQDEFNEVFALCHFLPGPNIVNLAVVFGGRLRGIPGSIAAFCGLIGPPMVLVTSLAALYGRYGELPALQRTLTGVSCAAVGLFLAVIYRMMMPLLKRREPIALALLVGAFVAVGLARLPLVWVLLVGVPLSIALTYKMRRRVRMNISVGSLLSLAWTFGLMSLLAIGGANSTIPEMHRVAVDVHHWMTDAQFSDMFAISQLSPGPNVLIVTLIGYQVAGVLGALMATFAMCGPAGALAYYVNHLLERSKHSPWPALLQSALVPLSIGLMCASGFILTLTVDRSWIAATITIVAAGVAMFTKLNPLWMLAVGGMLGFAGFL